MIEPQPRDSWSDLLSGIVSDATRLFAKEIEFAKLEMSREVSRAKGKILGVAAGAFILLIGVGLLCVALALALAAYTTLPPWACFGLVGGGLVLSAIACFALLHGGDKKIGLMPQQAAEAVKEDIGWIHKTITRSSATNKNGSKRENR